MPLRNVLNGMQWCVGEGVNILLFWIATTSYPVYTTTKRIAVSYLEHWHAKRGFREEANPFIAAGIRV